MVNLEIRRILQLHLSLKQNCISCSTALLSIFILALACKFLKTSWNFIEYLLVLNRRLQIMPQSKQMPLVMEIQGYLIEEHKGLPS